MKIKMGRFQLNDYHRNHSGKRLSDLIIGIKGAGEMASGVAYSLYQSNIRNIFMMEVGHPMAVRRTVSFCDAIYSGPCQIEGIAGVVARDVTDIFRAWENGAIAVIPDPEWKTLPRVAPDVVIDATLAKVNLGTRKDEAPVVIGLGPGFKAGRDVHMVIETHRGHDLGRIINDGAAHPNTGVPGDIGGYTHQRVLRAPCDGIFETQFEIGVLVKAHQVIGRVGEQAVKTPISGVLRGLIHPNAKVKSGLKIGDVDPRGTVEFCYTISDKARALGGSVLQAILSKLNITDKAAYSLADVIGFSGRGVISLFGAGGKTTLMFRLAKELVTAGKSVLTTTTTKIFFPEKDQSPLTLVAAEDKLLAEMRGRDETAPHISAGSHFDRATGKLIGLSPESVDRIWHDGLFDAIIVEADGSKQLPLKASAGHEPVIPVSTSHLVHISGLDAIGKAVEEGVHRPDILMKNLGLEPGTLLSESHLADCILREVQKADKQCHSLVNSVIFNKADTLKIEKRGKIIADRLKGHPCIHHLAGLALSKANPVKFIQ